MSRLPIVSYLSPHSLVFSTHLHRNPGIFSPYVWTLPSKSYLPFCLKQVYNYLCGQGGDVTVRNQPSNGDADQSPELDHFYIISTSSLCTMLEIPDFLDDIKATVANKIENTQNKLQGSGWAIREITRFNITICKFARGSLGSYKAYPRDIRGKHNIVNPNIHENCVLIAIAAFFNLKTNPNIESGKLSTKIQRNPRRFWQSRVNIGTLDSTYIVWELISELEKLNHISINIYNLAK